MIHTHDPYLTNCKSWACILYRYKPYNNLRDDFEMASRYDTNLSVASLIGWRTPEVNGPKGRKRVAGLGILMDLAGLVLQRYTLCSA